MLAVVEGVFFFEWWMGLSGALDGGHLKSVCLLLSPIPSSLLINNAVVEVVPCSGIWSIVCVASVGFVRGVAHPMVGGKNSIQVPLPQFCGVLANYA